MKKWYVIFLNRNICPGNVFNLTIGGEKIRKWCPYMFVGGELIFQISQ